MKKRIAISLFLGTCPIVLMGFSTGPPTKRTGASVDGGLNCTACHRSFAPANSDPRGNVRIDVSNYAPGVKQTVRVTVTHPEAVRWGFQVTARLVSDETKPAGDFAGSSVVKVMCDDGLQLGSAAPCSPTQNQFAEHVNAPRTDVGAGFTFEIEWTPPATNLGDVVFYAAGNATDGSGGNTGDRVFTTVRRISGPCTLTAKPSTVRALNGASFGDPWNAGSVMSLFGSNFAPAGQTRGITSGDIVDRRFPQTLGCIAVTINGQNAPMIYVQSNQINFQAPALASVGSASVVVIANPGATNEVRSDAVTITTQQAFAPALFTFDGKSVAATSADGTRVIARTTVVPGASTAKPGDVVVLYGTGMGPTTPDVAPGEITPGAANFSSAVTITIGGVAVPASDILYAGLSPQSISGLAQFNVRLPQSLPDGDLPVLISIGGSPSSSGTTIPVAR
jgi:uncharacterized protein (TIGR03437 family)